MIDNFLKIIAVILFVPLIILMGGQLVYNHNWKDSIDQELEDLYHKREIKEDSV